MARLAARNHDLPEALRYYHHALYGLWTGEKVDEQRRQVRLELIDLLLEHKERSRALAELMVLSTDAPQTAPVQLQLGQRYVEAGDVSSALQHFAQAAQLDSGNAAALSGAGETAFQLGDYKTAEGYLSRATALDRNATRAAQLLETTRLIQTSDPLVVRLSRSEQIQRLRAALDQASRRLPCNVSSGPVKSPLQLEIDALLPKITPENLREDPELLAAGAELVFKIEETTSQTCGKPVGLDEALLLAGRKHGGER